MVVAVAVAVAVAVVDDDAVARSMLETRRFSTKFRKSSHISSMPHAPTDLAKS